ncbi:hypothetical protein GU926_01810 [Nibribacter ruber]|uniref:Toxin-antitoxin system YwqK family antitoxin n=1 Tax=Nibribacter ruber TaxID=2698458 RepID=A0A6P1NRE1_9BACT|nr:hypothetical protein [Nibribacter ruber]QHL86247.1 hypothetical protein GU926_01810 [Nibribacter ruber]
MRKNIQTMAAVLGVWLLCATAAPALALGWPWKWNQLDKEGNRHGKWRVFYEHKPGQVMSQGRYKHGKDRGTWRTFSQDGHLERREKYTRRGKQIKTTFYYPNGKVAHAGLAYLFEEDGYLMYKWHGNWQYYDSTGAWVGWKAFHRGKPLSEKPLTTKPTK